MKFCLLWGWWSNSLAKKLEESALLMRYFVSRNLYPNVDFYSGIIYRALEFLLICLQLCCYGTFTRLDCTMERNERK
jgi:hypothetical protein